MKLNFIKSLGVVLLVVAGGFICTAALKKEHGTKMKVVAITQYLEHPALDETYRGILEELHDRGYIPGKTITLIYELAQGSSVIAAQIAKKFVGTKPDVMVGIATLSAQSLVNADRNREIPIIFASVTDPVGAQLLQSLKNVEGGNVTGVSNWIELGPQLEKFRQILPGLKKLGFIYNPGEGNSVVLLERLRGVATKMGIEIFAAPATVTAEVSMATKSIVSKVDAIFISNDNAALSAFHSIINIANNAGIPVFVSDIDLVESGAVAALGPNQYQLGRQTGRMIASILEGASPGNMPVGFPEQSEFYLNANAMSAINLVIPDELKAQADKVCLK